jgi:uncharacterized membrane protein HdeD (DUF308 family)
MPDPLQHPVPGPVHLIRLAARHWWLFALRGVAALLFAALAVLVPQMGLALMLGFLAAWLAVEGLATLWKAATGHAHGLWFWLDGLLSLGAAAFLLLAPAQSALGLVIVTGAWSIASGAIRLVLAFRLANVLLGVLGAIAVFFGCWLVLNPEPGLLALVWLVGLQALFMGAVLLGLAWRLRKLAQDPHHHG